jgi:hypothetical protein
MRKFEYLSPGLEQRERRRMLFPCPTGLHFLRDDDQIARASQTVLCTRMLKKMSVPPGCWIIRVKKEVDAFPKSPEPQCDPWMWENGTYDWITKPCESLPDHVDHFLVVSRFPRHRPKNTNCTRQQYHTSSAARDREQNCFKGNAEPCVDQRRGA